MSRLTFISNADVHLTGTGAGITAAASGVSGIWNLNTGAWQAAAALTAADRIQFVQGKGAGSYPLFSQIFDCKDLKIVYTPYVQAAKQSIAITVGGTSGAGTIHGFKLIRRATDIGYDKLINSGSDDFSYTDKIVTVEHIETATDTTTTIAASLAAAVNSQSKFGFTATSAAAVCTVVAAEFGHEFDITGLGANETAVNTAKVEGSGNYHQVISAEKETQAMHGYHNRAGAFLQTPATFTSTAIAPVVPSATLGYDAVTLYIKNDSDVAVSRKNEFTELTLYFDGVNANMANWATIFGISTPGTAETIQL